MKNIQKLGIIIPLLLWMTNGYAQFISIVNKKFVVNGNASCPIYMNGANTPWEAWNDFGGSYNVTKWNQDMIDLKNKGINCSRIWFSCNGSGQPSVASDGTASAPTAAFWQNCDSLFASAKRNGVYIMATMMSFDHTKPSNTRGTNWQQMMNTQAKTQTYIDNYLIPFVNRYKTNPYLFSIDLCNEIEWIAENGKASGTDKNWGCSYAILQRFIGQCAAALHGSSVARTDGTKVLVTLGSAGTKWNATKMRNGANGTGLQNNPDGNKWSDAALQAQFANSAAYLDFYSPHYYGWLDQYYSNMFQRSPTELGMDDKACMVGEMPARDPMPTPAMGQQTAYNNLKTLGWQGHQPWTSNITTNLTTEVGSLADFGAAALAFKNANASLIVPSCASNPCTTTAPTVTSAISYCQGTTATALSATGTSLLWYTASSGGTGSSSAIIPSTARVGTTSYYVSQTVNSCEGPRATIAVTVNALPTANAGTDVAICIGKSTTLTASGGTTYSWNNTITTATNSVSPTTTTTYLVTVTNSSSCKATDAVIVTVNSLPTVNAGSDVAICSGKATTLTASGGSSYVWNNAILTASNTVSPSTTSTFTVTATNSNGCSATDAIVVSVNPIPSAPTVVSPINYYQNDVASQLSATGTNLLWYNVSTGGSGSSSAPTPSTVTIGTASFYVSQTTSCESLRSVINVITSVRKYTQNISLLQGWNLISFSLSPSNKTIDSVFSTVLTQIDEVKNADAFWKNGQATSLNRLTQITDGGAYLVYMNSATTLTITGYAIATPISISLKTGWNLVGVPSQSSADIATKVSTNPITAVKNFDGFWNTTSIPSISKFEPGKGYFIKATGPTTVSY